MKSNFEIVEKAYQCYADIEEAEYYFSDGGPIETGKTKGEVKNKAFISYFESNRMKYTGEDVQYKDIKARRVPDYDIVIYNGKNMSRKSAENNIKEKERDENIKKLRDENPGALAVVWNGSYGTYWGDNRCGYNSSLCKAGIYSIEEAANIVIGSSIDRDEKVIIVTNNDINSSVDEEIQALEKKISYLNEQISNLNKRKL